MVKQDAWFFLLVVAPSGIVRLPIPLGELYYFNWVVNSCNQIKKRRQYKFDPSEPKI